MSLLCLTVTDWSIVISSSWFFSTNVFGKKSNIQLEQTKPFRIEVWYTVVKT